MVFRRWISLFILLGSLVQCSLSYSQREAFIIFDSVTCEKGERVRFECRVSGFSDVRGLATDSVLVIQWNPSVIQMDRTTFNMNTPNSICFPTSTLELGRLILTDLFCVPLLSLDNGDILFSMEFQAVGMPGTETEVSLVQEFVSFTGGSDDQDTIVLRAANLGLVEVTCPIEEVEEFVESVVCFGDVLEDVMIRADTLLVTSKIDTCGCPYRVFNQIAVRDSLVLLFEQEFVDCVEGLVMIEVLDAMGQMGNVEVLWDDGTEGRRRVLEVGQSYAGVAEKEGFCSTTFELTPDLISLDIISIDSIRLNSSRYQLEVIFPEDISIVSILWSTGENSIQIEVSDSGMYGVVVEDADGCMYAAELTLMLEEIKSTFIPNAFTPNGDNVNDTWSIYTAPDIKEIKTLEVYDRWGNVIVERKELFSPQFENIWDGKDRRSGQTVNTGAYIYKLVLVKDDDEEQLISGALYVLP